MLQSGGAKIADFRFRTKLPKIVIGLYILRHKMAIFGIFSNFFVKYPQKHLVMLDGILTFGRIIKVHTVSN